MSGTAYPKGRLVIGPTLRKPEGPPPFNFSAEIKLYPFQREALEKITEAGQLRFAGWPRGLGKSYSAATWDLARKPSKSALALFRRTYPDLYRFWKRMDWANWYISRGRMTNAPTPSEFRRVSWRRPL